MQVHEIKTKTISLDETDIRTAIVFWLRERSFRDIDESIIEFSGCFEEDCKLPLSAEIKIIEEINPDKK